MASTKAGTSTVAEITASNIALSLSETKAIVVTPASALTPEQREAITRDRAAVVDELERDELLRTAMTYLSRRGAPYVPTDIMDDVNSSYENDSLEDFRGCVREWVKALLRHQKEAH